MGSDFVGAAEAAARLAGDVLADWSTRFTVREKNPKDLVTEADHAAQKAIHEFLVARYPDHGFLGEEGLTEVSAASEYRWIIDPLDGTSNYVHGFPYYAVSIALEHSGTLLAGVIFDPTRNELFSAVRGQGAKLNDEPIAPSSVSEISQAMLVASLPRGCAQNDPAVTRFLTAMAHAETVQRTGSAALNLASVATGRIDAFWSTSLQPWDVAAGVLIVQEAGGKVTQLDGRFIDIEVPDLLASNGNLIHSQIQNLFQ